MTLFNILPSFVLFLMHLNDESQSKTCFYLCIIVIINFFFCLEFRKSSMTYNCEYQNKTQEKSH